MKIELIDLSELTPYNKNARKHQAKDLETIKASIEEFGMNDPIGIWGKDNIIVEGHGRAMACKELGITTVPCIRLDHLTDEQRRAYTLAHNKTAEMSDWDYDILGEELDQIFDIDMESFGFEFYDAEGEHEKNVETTQFRVENIENLALGSFKGEGYYDIPIIKPVKKLPEIKEWIGFNYVLSDDNPEGKAVHFFIDDYQFERIWNNPEKYVEKLSKYVAVATPDFSPYGDMPNILQIYNHYRKHWIGAYLQERGITVIPTIRASTDKRSFDWYLDGEPKKGIVLISSMWAKKGDMQKAFMEEYNKMFDTLNPCKVLLYGNEIEGLKGNVEYIPSFTRKRWDS